MDISIKDIDTYIALQPIEVREKLEQMRSVISSMQQKQKKLSVMVCPLLNITVCWFTLLLLKNI